MTDYIKKFNQLIVDVQMSEYEGEELKLFVSKKVIESIKLLAEYFQIYIKKIQSNNNRNSNNRNSNNRNISMRGTSSKKISKNTHPLSREELNDILKTLSIK